MKRLVYKVKAPRGVEVAVEIDNNDKVRFWYNDYREGGYYTPENSIEIELGKIFYRYNDYTWLKEVCNRLNLQPTVIIKLGIEYYIERYKVELSEIEDKIEKLTDDRSTLKHKINMNREKLHNIDKMLD